MSDGTKERAWLPVPGKLTTFGVVPGAPLFEWPGSKYDNAVANADGTYTYTFRPRTAPTGRRLRLRARVPVR